MDEERAVVAEKPREEQEEKSERKWTRRRRMTESCPICLYPMERRRVALPGGCRHAFCLRCLRRWSKRKATCPVCRARYKSILVQARYSRRFTKRIVVKAAARPKTDDYATYLAVLQAVSRIILNFMGSLFLIRR